MFILVALLLGVVVSLAAKRHNGPDILGHWRYAVGALGAGLPYLEVVFHFWGPGAYLQAYHGVMWSLLVLPLTTLLAAGVAGMFLRVNWSAAYPPILWAALATVVAGALTEEGIMPFAPLLGWHLNASVLHPVDGVLLGLSLLTLVVAYVFRDFRRDVARLGLACVLAYVLLIAYWGYEARRFGHEYARALSLEDVQVRVLPQPLSALNWRVVVEETAGGNAGRLHETAINLRRQTVAQPKRGSTYAAQRDSQYLPLNMAIWKVHRRFGGEGLSAAERKQVWDAWQAWQGTPFGWQGRYAVFAEFVPAPPGKALPESCVRFADLRYLHPNNDGRGLFVVCLPVAKRAQPRLFSPSGTAYTELVPVFTAGALSGYERSGF